MPLNKETKANQIKTLEMRFNNLEICDITQAMLKKSKILDPCGFAEFFRHWITKTSKYVQDYSRITNDFKRITFKNDMKSTEQE